MVQITTPNVPTATYERYVAQEYSDVLYYDIPYCGQQSPPPPPSNNLVKLYILFESEYDLLNCSAEMRQNNFKVNIYSVL